MPAFSYCLILWSKKKKKMLIQKIIRKRKWSQAANKIITMKEFNLRKNNKMKPES